MLVTLIQTFGSVCSFWWDNAFCFQAFVSFKPIFTSHSSYSHTVLSPKMSGLTYIFSQWLVQKVSKDYKPLFYMPWFICQMNCLHILNHNYFIHTTITFSGIVCSNILCLKVTPVYFVPGSFFARCHRFSVVALLKSMIILDAM